MDEFPVAPANPALVVRLVCSVHLSLRTVHVLDDVTLYVPLYRLQVPELAITAAVSLITAVALFGLRIDRTRD